MYRPPLLLSRWPFLNADESRLSACPMTMGMLSLRIHPTLGFSPAAGLLPLIPPPPPTLLSSPPLPLLLLGRSVIGCSGGLRAWEPGAGLGASRYLAVHRSQPQYVGCCWLLFWGVECVVGLGNMSEEGPDVR